MCSVVMWHMHVHNVEIERAHGHGWDGRVLGFDFCLERHAIIRAVGLTVIE